MIRILLVDDHAATREPLAFMLDLEPDLEIVAQAGSVDEGRAAIARLGDTVDVALIDLALPDGSGSDLIADLHQRNPGAKSLVLTYYTDRERLAEPIAAGSAGILHKSEPVEAVMDAVRKAHEGIHLLPLQEVVAAYQYLDQQRRLDSDQALALNSLTSREREVLQALADGLSDREIAERLHVSFATVRSHVTSILTKLGATSRLQGLVIAVRHGMVTID
jgi:DNA-binding NarL/FixJ family response regulator